MKASHLARAVPTLLLSTTLACGIATSSFAQTSPATTPQGGTTSSMPSNGAATATPGTTTMTPHATATPRERTRAGRASGETMQQLVEHRIADLHARLHITAQEQPQWDQFAQVMRDNAKDVDQAYQQRAAQIQSMNAVENMQSFTQIEQQRVQDMQKLVPAFQTLYSSLSDQQKKTADQLFRNYAENAQHGQKASGHS